MDAGNMNSAVNSNLPVRRESRYVSQRENVPLTSNPRAPQVSRVAAFQRFGRAFHLNFCAKDRIADWIRNIEVGSGHDRRIMMFQMMLS